MSEALTIETETEPTRRSRTERPIRPEPEAPMIESAAEQITPEEALADSRQQLQESNRQLAEQRRLAREADNRRVAAEQQAAQLATARTNDHTSVAASAIEAAKAEQQAARTALRLAREAGDIDADIAAQEALAGATYRLSQSTSELERLKAQPRPEQRQQPAAGRTTEAQQWLDNHPRFFSDAGYKSTAMGAHTDAIQAGLQEGSAQYVQHIDRIMNQVYGDGHETGSAQQQADGGRQVPNNAQRPAARSDGPPPSRGGGSANAGGYKAIRTPLGEVRVRYSAGKVTNIQFTSPEQRDNFEEGARLDRGYEKDPARALTDYAMEQVRIGEEIASGGTGDLITGEGQTFR